MCNGCRLKFKGERDLVGDAVIVEGVVVVVEDAEVAAIDSGGGDAFKLFRVEQG